MQRRKARLGLQTHGGPEARMPGLCVRCLFAQRTSNYMSSARYRCSYRSRPYRVRPSFTCSRRAAAQARVPLIPTRDWTGLDSHCAIDSAIPTRSTPGCHRLTTRRKRWLMSRVTCLRFRSAHHGTLPCARSRLRSIMRGGVAVPQQRYACSVG